MAIFTFIATTILGLTAGSFAAGVAVFAMSSVASIGLSYIARALSGQNATDTASDPFSIQGKLNAGGAVPRSFNLGYSATAGSLTYANTWGDSGDSPNAYLSQCIALSDMPGCTLSEVWVNGTLCTIGAVTNPLLGAPINEYTDDKGEHLWIRFHDGLQTTADELLVSRASTSDRPYESTRVGVGIAYIVCTAYVNDTLFSGFPTFKFALSGIPLYDPSRDSTVGGSGSHRYSDPSTWGGDGDDLPVVQIYNLLRGIKYNGQWLYGLQSMSGPRLPTSNWIAQINKCRELIVGEPTYRSGGQISVDAATADAVEALLSACQGKLSEIGGFYKINVGAPGSPVFSWTDADLLSTEEQTFRPFFALADSVNGIQVTYPDPAQGWNTTTAPAYYRTDIEATDGGRRLMASPALNFVPYAQQVQRLQKSAIEEAQRARTHVLPFPPEFWIVEPGDIGAWTSDRNGYDQKLFRVDGMTDRANLDVTMSVTEVDPADYDWHGGEFIQPTVGGLSFTRPGPQGIMDWFAEGVSIYDNNSIARRPAIRLSWDNSVGGVVGVQYEIRSATDNTVVTGGRTDQLDAGAIIVSQSILPATNYQARGQYLPSAPREMLWSDWLDVTTPDTRLSLLDFEAALSEFVTNQFNEGNARIAAIEDLIASLMVDQDAANRVERINDRKTLEYREQALSGSIDTVSTIASSTASVFASYQVTVATQFGDLSSSVSTVANSLSSLNNAYATYTVTTNAAIGNLSSTVTQTSTAVAGINGKLAASWAVDIDVNGYAFGFKLIGDQHSSAFVIRADLFQIAFPGASGPVPVFQIANVNGAARLAFRGDMFADGTITSRNMTAGSINAINGAIDNLAVRSFNIGDNAVTVPIAQSGSAFTGNNNWQVAATVTFPIDTTGLAGKPYTIFAMFTAGISYTTDVAALRTQLTINGQLMVETGGNRTVFNTVASGALTFTASGGNEYRNVAVNIYAESSIIIGDHTLCVWAVKR